MSVHHHSSGEAVVIQQSVVGERENIKHYLPSYKKSTKEGKTISNQQKKTSCSLST